MQRLGVHAAVICTLDYIAEPGLAAEAFTPQETDKLAKAAAILSDVEVEARRLDLGFHYELPSPAAAGTACRENIGRSLYVSADGSMSPCVYVNVPMGIADPKRRVFGNVRDQDPCSTGKAPRLSPLPRAPRRRRPGSALPELPLNGS